MKKYIVDSSTTLKWVFDDEKNVSIARNLLLKYLENRITLIAPSLWLVETANAVKSALLSKRVNTRKADKLLGLMLEAKPKLVPFEAYIKDSYKNAIKYEISVYDSIFLTIALENKISFITADKKLCVQLRSLKEKVVFLGDFVI